MMLRGDSVVLICTCPGLPSMIGRTSAAASAGSRQRSVILDAAIAALAAGSDGTINRAKTAMPVMSSTPTTPATTFLPNDERRRTSTGGVCSARCISASAASNE